MQSPLNAPGKPEHRFSWQVSAQHACLSSGSAPVVGVLTATGGPRCVQVDDVLLRQACLDGAPYSHLEQHVGSCLNAPALHPRPNVGRTHLCAARQSWGFTAHMPNADLWPR